MGTDCSRYRLAFLGTPAFAVPAFERLVADGYNISLVYTNPDRSQGRHQELLPSPVKAAALTAGLTADQIRQPAKFTAAEATALVEANLDAAIVVAYGHILPEEVLNIPRKGFLNVHASLLPRWRGAAPIQAVIRAGDKETGVTLMEIVPTLDAGPTYAQKTLPLTGQEMAPELFESLALLGAELVSETLPTILEEDLSPTPQPEEGITTAPQLKREDGLVDWEESATQIEQTFRAYQPWPGIFTTLGGKRLMLQTVHVHPGGTLSPGEVTREANGSLAIGTAAGRLVVTELQLEGDKRLNAAEFLRGHGEIIGTILPS